jgi:AraC family transcriptional regulator
MNVLDCFRQGIDYIESNLLNDLSNGEVAESVNLSPSSFQRIFGVLAGVGVSEYIRNRRLSLAGKELLGRKETQVTELAFKYGYDSLESFSRAFRAFHGCLPSEAKRGKVHLAFYPRLEIVVSIKGGKMMNYEIVEDKSYTIVVLPKTIACGKGEEECPKAWDEFYAKGYRKNVPPMLGVCLPSQEKDSFVYGIGSTAECCGEVPDGFKTIEIPRQTYAKFTSHGVIPEAIQRLWKSVLTEWLPNSKYELVDAPEFECYTEGDPSSPDYEFAIWLPVKRK